MIPVECPCHAAWPAKDLCTLQDTLILLFCSRCYCAFPSRTLVSCPLSHSSCAVATPTTSTHQHTLKQYEGGEPCSICGHVMLPPGAAQHESCMPATIISGFLYLGSYDTASRQDLLKAMGITHVLNVRAAAGGGGVGRTAAGFFPAASAAQQRHATRAPHCGLRTHAKQPLLPCLALSGCVPADRAQLPSAVQEHLHLPHS